MTDGRKEQNMSVKKSFGTEPVEDSLEYLVYKLLKERRYTLTTAESATGGMIASTLVNVPGISEFFTEGYVTYSDAAKVKMIHVNPKTIEKYGVVSSETACDMAKSAAREDGDRALYVREKQPERAAGGCYRGSASPADYNA